MKSDETEIDWSKTTWDGSRREQLRRWRKLSLRERLLAVDEMAELSQRFGEMREQRRSHGVQGAPEDRISNSERVTEVRESSPSYGNAPANNEIVLDGCTPAPLANYLKALGVLRLLSARYPGTRGFWRGDRFVLRTPLSQIDIERFFLDDYEPTPIVAPWNGGSGFYYQERKSKEKDPSTGKRIKLEVRDQPTAATKIVDSIMESKGRRLKWYRSSLALCREIVKGHTLEKAPDAGESKDRLVISLRAELHDKCLEWVDAVLSITSSGTKFPTLLGTGGNDANMDFTSNFMQRVVEVIGTNEGEIPEQSSVWLRMSLFALAAPGLQKNKIGQFSPGQIGGKNASIGFDADAFSNPWDVVFTLEGALVFASAAVRRHANDPYNTMSFPFTVNAVGAGSGTLGAPDSDTRHTRGELWMPFWPQPATYAEVRALMAEGRVALGKKPARDALDFVRAIRRLGSYRGVREYQRYGRLQRNGDNHLFTPLSRVEVNVRLSAPWLDDLDKHYWLDDFRRFGSDKSAANRFKTLAKRLEDALFAQSGCEPSKADAQALLTLLGEIQFALSTSQEARESVRPIPRLSEQWVAASDDDTPAFRIAKALAGLRGVGDEPLPLRAQLFPVHRSFDQWMTPDAGEKVRVHTGRKGRLVDTLRALLDRRLWLAERLEMRDKPLASPAGATLDDVAAFLRSDHMDERIADLLPGLCLCEIPEDIDKAAGQGSLSAAFSLLKLALTPDRVLRGLGWLGEKDHLPIPAGMLAQLGSGNHANRAVQTTWRRLHASGLAPAFSQHDLPKLSGFHPLRAAAALLIPLRFGATGALAQKMLEASEPEIKSA